MINLSYKKFRLSALFLCALLTACAQNSTSISSTYSTIFNLITESVFKDEDGISAEVIKNIPYASSLINFKKSPQSLIILESKQRDTYTWVSSDNKVFLTEDGRIVGTIGLTNDLFKITRPDISFKQILNNQNQEPYFAYYSFKKPNLNNLKVKITHEVIGRQKIMILEKEKDVILVEERLESKKIYWKGTNRFWVDPQSFFVWKSQQNISPKLPLLNFEIQKKPAL
jgi:hypothetical protein